LTNTLDRRTGRSKCSERVARQLDRDTRKLRCDWWETETASLIMDLAKARAFHEVLCGLAEVIRETADPLWVIGGTTATQAHAVAWEWLDAGIEPREVPGWLRAGCWDPKAARRMADEGLGPAQLLDDDGEPLDLVEGTNGDLVPLAMAVADRHLTAAEAVKAVVNRGLVA
jgi:hypothetical protein